MGKAKAILKRIQDDKVRKSTFSRRKTGLFKKFSTFSKICAEAESCLIVYDDDASDSPPQIWPQNPTFVNSVIDRYYENLNSSHKLKVEDFFEDKMKTVEDDIRKVKKDILDIKFPTSHPGFLQLGPEILESLIADLDGKITACDQKINFLKKNTQQIQKPNFNFGQEISETQFIPAPVNQLSIGNVEVHGVWESILQTEDDNFSFAEEGDLAIELDDDFWESIEEEGDFSCAPPNTAEKISEAELVLAPVSQLNSEKVDLTIEVDDLPFEDNFSFAPPNTAQGQEISETQLFPAPVNLDLTSGNQEDLYQCIDFDDLDNNDFEWWFQGSTQPDDVPYAGSSLIF